jgi:hypothetical protein
LEDEGAFYSISSLQHCSLKKRLIEKICFFVPQIAVASPNLESAHISLSKLRVRVSDASCQAIVVHRSGGLEGQLKDEAQNLSDLPIINYSG